MSAVQSIECSGAAPPVLASAAPTFAVTLALPPSANNMFVNLKGGGRAKSAVYKSWCEEARYHVITAWRAAGKPEWPAATPMQIHIRLGIEGRSRDPSNCIKAIEDVLVRELPVPDDRWNDFGSWQRDENIPGLARVTIGSLDST